MSKSLPMFEKVPVRVPNLSGHNKSHMVQGTMPIGSLVPLLVDNIMPNTRISLGMLANLELPPLAVPFTGKVDVHYSAFFVPHRLVWDGWKSFMSRQNQYDPDSAAPTELPKMLVNTTSSWSTQGTTLLDAMGYGVRNDGVAAARTIPMLNVMAYHRIYQDWYRDARIQKAAFNPNSSQSTCAKLPWRVDSSIGSDSTASKMNDGVGIFELRQRNWSKDYFTSAQLKQSLGDNLRVAIDGRFTNSVSFEPTLSMSGSGDGPVYQANHPENSANLGFTIAQLRSTNALQMYMDTLGAVGNRYEDVCRAIYGISPADETVNKAILINDIVRGVYCNGGVMSVASDNDDSAAAVQTNYNPFNGVQGAEYGKANTTAQDSICDNFLAAEAGTFMVLASIVPHATYGSVSDRSLYWLNPSDFPTNILAAVGNQEIYDWELDDSLANAGRTPSVFGWTTRFGEAMFKNDRVFGGLRELSNSDLSIFTIQRNFAHGSNPQLSTAFLQIPKDFLNGQFACPTDPAGREGRVDVYFNYNVVDTLPEFIIPTLENTSTSHVKLMDKGGRRL